MVPLQSAPLLASRRVIHHIVRTYPHRKYQHIKHPAPYRAPNKFKRRRPAVLTFCRKSTVRAASPLRYESFHSSAPFFAVYPIQRKPQQPWHPAAWFFSLRRRKLSHLGCGDVTQHDIPRPLSAKPVRLILASTVLSGHWKPVRFHRWHSWCDQKSPPFAPLWYHFPFYLHYSVHSAWQDGAECHPRSGCILRATCNLTIVFQAH